MTEPGPSDFSGWIPPEFSTQIIQEALQQSAALALGTRLPMGTSISQLPVPKTFPKAAWTSTGGRKPFTDVKVDTETITAEEVSAVIAIPDAFVEDSSINLWNFARPLLSEAIAVAVDDAVLWGVDAPATFPTGGIAASALAVPTGTDAADTINQAMSAVEAQGLSVTGHAADLTVRGALRGVRDANGAFLMGTTQADNQQINTIYGLPVSYNSFSEDENDFITGAWQYLVMGVRSDIRFDMNPAGVIADADGKVIISGWQDNTTPLKVWARFGCALVKPVTRRAPGGAEPFAMATVAGVAAGGGGDSGDSGDTRAAAKKAPAKTAA